MLNGLLICVCVHVARDDRPCGGMQCCVWTLGMICLVVAMFYWAGWELGAVEAISLSILVGSSVDYCVHVVEGYLLAGHSPPSHVTQVGCRVTCTACHTDSTGSASGSRILRPYWTSRHSIKNHFTHPVNIFVSSSG